jgi:hypothetical protein
MAYNRELSQFASLVEVNDTSKRIGIQTDIRVSGVVTANYYYGDGRYLTDIVASFVPSGPAKSIQLNNGGYPAGANNFFYDTGTDNVGIGTSSPTSKFHVVGNALYTGISTFLGNPVIIGSATSTGSTNQPLQVTGTAYISGALGIGTTNPYAPLHINASSLHSDGSSYLRIISSSGFNYVQSGKTLVSGSSTDLIFGSIYAGTEWARFKYDNFLIGSPTPTGTSGQKLQVAGGAYIRDNLGLNYSAPTSQLHVQGDVYISGVSTATSYSVTNSFQINNVPVVNSSRGLQNITSGAIIGINSNGQYIGAGTTTLDFVGTGASVRLNQTSNKIEVALRDAGITGRHVTGAEDIFGWVPKTYTTSSNITISTDNAGSSASYVISNLSNITIGNGFSLTVDSGKTMIINPLDLSD